MGVCLRYHSKKRGKYVSDLIGLVEVTDCSGEGLAGALKEYLSIIGLILQNMESIGVDGAPNMSGLINSFYAHPKRDVPNLKLFKCICHSVDKSAEHAFKDMPEEVENLLDETNNYFAYSHKRWSEYAEYYKTLNGGKAPKRLMSRAKTRWLVWHPAAESLLEQWYELKGFFTMQSAGNAKGAKKAREIVGSYTGTNMLYLSFLRSILIGVLKVNKAFEQTDADVTKLYTDLRTLVFSLAWRILKPQCMAQASRPGMFRCDEIKMLRDTLGKSENLLPIDRVNLGDSFNRTAQAEKVPVDMVNAVRHNCGKYIFTLVKILLDKLPTNLDAVSALRFITPRMALAKTARPTFQELPVELDGDMCSRDLLESQWNELGTLTLTDIMDEGEKIDNVDIADFWTAVLNFKNAGGDITFKELALFALKALTVPVSNAVVERAFSVMSCIKCRRRNRLQLKMLEGLMRLRIHLKVDGQCCKDFKPSKTMLGRFTSEMYQAHHEGHNRDDEYNDPDDPDTVCEGPENVSEVVEELHDVDYEVLSMIDATDFNENLVLL